MTALFTDELERLLAQAVSGRMKMLGVFSADVLPIVNEIRSCSSSTISNSCCFAVNTDPSHRPGKHWVLFIGCRTSSANANESFHLEYFDSYGMPMELYRDLYDSCLHKGLLPLIKQYNTVMLQDVKTSVCGHYCVLFANLRATGRSFAAAVRNLSSCAASTLDRDNFVVRRVYAMADRTNSSTSSSSSSNSLRLSLFHSGIRLRQCCCNCTSSSK
jgi:hypothetical protein